VDMRTYVNALNGTETRVKAEWRQIDLDGLDLDDPAALRQVQRLLLALRGRIAQDTQVIGDLCTRLLGLDDEDDPVNLPRLAGLGSELRMVERQTDTAHESLDFAQETLAAYLRGLNFTKETT
jgi:hypothetical protein